MVGRKGIAWGVAACALFGCDGLFAELPDRPEPGFAGEGRMGDGCGPCGRFLIQENGTCQLDGLEGVNEQDACDVLGFVDTDATSDGVGSEEDPWRRWPTLLPEQTRVVFVAGTAPLESSLLLDKPLQVRGGYERLEGRFVPSDKSRDRARGNLI